MTEDTFNSFPNPLASPEQKGDKSYGIQYAKSIWATYSSLDSINNERKGRWIINRKYAEGLQSVQKYKDRLDIKGDTSYLNLDFTPPPIIAQRVDIAVGKLINQSYKIQLDPIDPSSRAKEDDFRDRLYTNMLLKPIADIIEPATGVPLIPKNEPIPESNEEAELYMQLNYKSAEAMAMELAMQFVMDNNDFEFIKEKLIRDLINLKICSIKKYYDYNLNIKVDYIDPIDLIYPYSKHDDFRNIPYVAVIRKYNIQELSMMTDEFSEEDLFNIAKGYAGRLNNQPWGLSGSYGNNDGYYNNNSNNSGRPYDNFNINILEFEFLTVNGIQYTAKDNNVGGTFFQKRKSDYKTEKESKQRLHKKKIKERYEGSWIIGSDYIFNYKKSKNVPREKTDGAYSPETTLSINIVAPNIYDMENKSLTERMIPHADQMALIQLKTQQLVAKAIPPGVYINRSALDGVMKGMGQGVTPISLVEMFMQTGSLVGDDIRADGSVINGKAVEILPNGIPPGLDTLIALYNNEIQKINDITGFNAASDASTPSADSLVGVQKLALQATNNSFRPLNNSFISIIKRMASDITLMIQDKIQFGNGLEGFERAIGSQSVDTLSLSKIPLCEFGIKVEYLPDEQERAEIDAMIRMELESQQITLPDAIQVRQILKSNVKLATQMLVFKKKKNDEAIALAKKQDSETNGQIQVQSGQAVAQANMEAEQKIAEAKAQLLGIEYELKGKLSAQEHLQMMEEIRLKNQGSVKVAETTHDANLMQTAFNNATIPKKEEKV